MIECCTLGPLEMTLRGAPAPRELIWKKNAAVLLYLTQQPNHAAHRRELAEILWPSEHFRDPRHSLREAVRVIKRHLGDSIYGYEKSIRLADGVVQLDTQKFEQCLNSKRLNEAATLVRGVFLEGFRVKSPAFETWLNDLRQTWSSKCASTLGKVSDRSLSLGDIESATDAAKRALALLPVSDETMGRVLRCLVAQGDHDGAMALYDRFKTQLKERGKVPGDSVAEMARMIRGKTNAAPRSVA